MTPIPVQEAVEKVDVKEETKVEQKAETTEKPGNVIINASAEQRSARPYGV